MKDGFIKVSAVTTPVKPADVDYNVAQIIDAMKKEFRKGTKIAVFPELCITGATCGDLYMQKTLLDAAQSGLVTIADASKGHDTLFFVGLPWQEACCVYDAVAAVQDGEILAVLSDELNECIFQCTTVEDLVIGVDFGQGALPEATVVIQMVAEPETLGADDLTDEMLIADSSRDMIAIIRANAGEGESTTDEVYAGYNVIAETGEILESSEPFTTGAITTEIDVQAIALQRMQSGFEFVEDGYDVIDFELKNKETRLTRFIDPTPFIPEMDEDLERILKIQTYGLRGRMKAIGCEKLVIGISGGLDSTCALIVCAMACDSLGLPRKNIHAITMPCFGTSDRTYNNACRLAKLMGCRLTEINIGEAVTVHLKDIKHKLTDHNVAYENAQARERTQVLMDIANDEDALVVGTGDLSELALGWCTYNGDHMSSYAVNASVPKTLMRFLVGYYAQTCDDVELCDVLMDVVDTPVSPELLPTVKGKIAQKTEDKIGPYELHDFFLFNMIGNGFGPAKIFRLAKYAWGKTYDDKVIYKWLDTFVRRFFSSQFKRSCLPDGPATGLISLSPRGSWQMPSDASRNLWIKELESIKDKIK
ncbi:MAG: NAD(+) synthase [Lachnospiraceae bacterium]|nr:NAD(+) synthase [Lachnospiraceae bacterium]